MFNFLFKSWLLTSVFSSSFKKQQRQYERLIAEHYNQMDIQIEEFIELIRDDNNFYLRGIAEIMGCNLHLYSQEDINYILSGIYEEFPDEAIKIEKYIDELPGTPQWRGHGTEFI